MNQEIRFCTTDDGVRIAYARSGSGPPLLKAANWLGHLEFEQGSPILASLFPALSRHHTLVRYDERGCGLSDWDVEDFSFDAWVRDLGTVADAAGYERFALLGISQGGPVAIRYAVEHPERVERLILLGTFFQGWTLADAETAETYRHLVELARIGWGRANPAFRQTFSGLFVPGATGEELRWLNELQRVSTSAANAVRFLEEFGRIDVTDLLDRVHVPTLVLHARHDAVAPFEHGRHLAATIPESRFVPLDSENHLPLSHDPATRILLSEMRRFLGVEGEVEAAASVAAEEAPGRRSVDAGRRDPGRRRTRGASRSGDLVGGTVAGEGGDAGRPAETPLDRFVERLKRRKIGQWGLAYLAAAWAALEGLSAVADAWAVSTAVQRAAQVVLVVGFPVTLVLAWYHGERGQQRVTGAELLILALLLAIAGGLLALFV